MAAYLNVTRSRREWNNGSNVGDPPHPHLSLFLAFPLSHFADPPLSLSSFHSPSMTHCPHAQHLDAHKRLYNGGGEGGGGSGMERKWKNSRAAVQIQSEAAFPTSTFLFLQGGKKEKRTDSRSWLGEANEGER